MSRLRELFEGAVALAPDARERFLAEHCHDIDLREQVLRLLDADETQDELERLRLPALARGIGEAPAAPTVAAGDHIGPFELMSLLGEGGSATVWRARRVDDGVEQQVALKVLHRNLLSTAARRQFDRERRALAQLRHAHIARFIEGGVTAGGVAWLAIELIDGKPLTDHAVSEQLSLRARLRLFLAACRAVQSAHTALIVHRDLKPSNMMVTTDGHVKLLDFGIAKWLADVGDETRSMHRAFTPAYAAPEQRQGEVITTATDVYALGVILGELVSGQRVNEGDGITPSNAVLRDAPAAGLAAPPKQLRRLLRGDIDNIVMKAIAADPARRYESAGAMADDVERLLDGRPVHAHPPSRAYVLRKFVNRHRGSVAVTIVLLLATFLGLGMSVWQGMAARREAAIARAEAARADAMRDFMFDVFSESEPGAPRAAPMTVLEAADRAWRAAHDDPGADPRARIELLLRLAQMTLRQGDIPRASERTAEVRDEAVRVLGSDDPLALEAQLQLVRAHRTAGRYTEARSGIDDLLVRVPDEASELRVGVLRLSGVLAARPEQDAARAARDGERAIALARSMGDAGVLRQALSDRAIGLVDLGDAAAATPLLEEDLALNRARFGDRHENVARALAALSRTYRRAGDLERSEAAAREAIAMDRLIYPAGHWVLSNHLNALAVVLDLRGKSEEALAAGSESLEVSTRALGPKHQQTLIGKSFTAGLLSRTGREREARDAWLEAFAGLVETVGPWNGDTALERALLGYSEVELGEVERGAADIEGAVVMAEHASPPAPDALARVVERRVLVALRVGDAGAARTWGERLAAAIGAIPAPVSYWPGRAETLGAHATLLAGDAQAALAAAEAAAPRIVSSDYPGQILLAHNRLVTALAARALGRGKDAQLARSRATELISAMPHPPPRLVELAAQAGE